MSHPNESRPLAEGWSASRVNDLLLLTDLRGRRTYYVWDAPERAFVDAQPHGRPSYPEWRTTNDHKVVWRIDGPRARDGHVWYLQPGVPNGEMNEVLAFTRAMHPIISESEALRLIKQAQGPEPGKWQRTHDYAGEFRPPVVGPGSTDEWLDSNNKAGGVIVASTYGSEVERAIDNGNRFILRRKPTPLPPETEQSQAAMLAQLEAKDNEIARLKGELVEARKPGARVAEAVANVDLAKEIIRLQEELAQSRKPLVLDSITLLRLAQQAENKALTSGSDARWATFAISARALVQMLSAKERGNA